MKNWKISIIIPGYNAATHLESLFSRIPRSLWENIHTVHLINDGSIDTTLDVMKKIASGNNKIIVHHFEKNRGYGTVLKAGLSFCLEDRCDYAVCLHADGQYPPEYIDSFVGHMLKTNTDILQGTRLATGTALRGGMPLYKFIAGKCLTILENYIFNLKMTDYHSGFLMYSRKAMQWINFEELSSSFDFDIEIIASAKARRLRIAELPIPTRYANEKSYLNPVIYGLRVLGVLFKFSNGYYSPLRTRNS